MSGNKKILLVHPEISRTKYNFAGVIDNEPLELEYIYALLLKEGFEPDIWDGQVEKVPFAGKLAEFSPGYVYICGRTRQENFMKEYAKAAKELCGSTTFIGGLHAQKNYTRFYEDYIDYIITTFDVFKILQIILANGPENIPGICYKSGMDWVYTGDCAFDINRLLPPDRTYFYAHNDRYRYLELFPCAHVRTAYSCPFKCSFCYRNRLNCGVYTCRPIEDVVDEIAGTECDNIYIIDDDFLVDAGRIRQFIELIRQKNIHKKYVCYGRADFIAANKELMQELKDIGFYYILTGLEAVDEKYLRNYNKNSNLDNNAAAVEILNNVGINIMGMFILDLDFKAGDFTKIYRWIKKHHLKHAAVSIFTPEIGSELYEEYKDRLVTDNPEAWDYLHVVAKPRNMSVKAFYFHYHILVAKMFLRGWRQGIYDFVDYGYYIKSILKNLFRFGG